MNVKNNLFVLHTQYNIILSVAVIFKEFQSYRNDLILYSEFKLTDELYVILKNVFANVLVIRDKYENIEKNPIIREYNLYKEYKKYKSSELSKVNYDNVFLSQERPFDTLVVGDIKLRNNVSVRYVEEDCYYSINIQAKELVHKTLNSKSDYLRRLLYGSRYIYQPIYFYGQSSIYDRYYVSFPDHVRYELRGKKITEIPKEHIITAINLLYPHQFSMPDADKYLLIFFDLIDRYNNPPKIFRVFKDIIDLALSKGYAIMCKYHPRETQKINISESKICELPNAIPAEKVLTDLVDKDVLIIGNATTSILMARKLDFKAVSVAVIDDNLNEEMIGKMLEIGIETPKLPAEIFNV